MQSSPSPDDVSDIQSDPDPDDDPFGAASRPAGGALVPGAGVAAGPRRQGPGGAGVFSEEGVGMDRLDA